MNEIEVCETWLYSALSELGQAYNGLAPDTAEYPLITFAPSGDGTPLNTPDRLVWVDFSYIVKVWDVGSYNDTLFNSVVGVLDRASKIAVGEIGYIQSCLCAGFRSTIETEDETTYYSREAICTIKVKGV